MAIWLESLMGQYGDDDNGKRTPLYRKGLNLDIF